MTRKTLIIGTDFQTPKHLKTQGQFLKEVLIRYSIPAKIASRHRNYFLRIADTLIQLLSLRKNDVVIVQVYSSKGIYLECLSVLLGRLNGCRVISTLHGGDIPNQYDHNPNKRKLLDLIFKYSNDITAPSRFIPEQIPAIRNRYLLIRNIIELDHYKTQRKQPGEKIRIFWMRAYHPAYNPLKAVQIVEYLLHQQYDVEMVMAGSDLGLKEEILQYIASRNCSGKIRLLDVINNVEKNDLAANSTVYLCTNNIDNAPVSFLEMMAMGIPIVSTNIGGIPYYVTHMETALLSSDNSVENIASLIVELHQNNELRNRMIKNGYEFVKEFSADIVGAKWLNLIQHPLQTSN